MSDEELLEHAADDFTNAVDEAESIAGTAYSNRSIAASLLVIARHSRLSKLRATEIDDETANKTFKGNSAGFYTPMDIPPPN